MSLVSYHFPSYKLRKKNMSRREVNNTWCIHVDALVNDSDEPVPPQYLARAFIAPYTQRKKTEESIRRSIYHLLRLAVHY